jgi:hypothetical protein
MTEQHQHSSAATEQAVEKIIEDHIRMLDIGCGDEFRIPDAIAHARKEKTLAHANDLIGCIASWAAADIAKHLAGAAQATPNLLSEIRRLADAPDPYSPAPERLSQILALCDAAQPPAAPVETDTDDIDWDTLAEERLGQRPPRSSAGTGEEWNPTSEQVGSACMWYRHDFGLLGAVEAAQVRTEARMWLRAWQKEIAGIRAAPQEVKQPSAVERFQKRIVEMMQVGFTGFHLSTGDGWHSLDIEEKCAALLDMWDAERVDSGPPRTMKEPISVREFVNGLALSRPHCGGQS